MTNPFTDLYSGKRVLVTGHTGFKGSWLTLWLNQLGARVTGYSDEVPVSPSVFNLLGLETRIDHRLGNIRNRDRLAAVLDEVRPDMVGQFGYTNPMQVPKLSKIVINMGVGEASQDKKKIESALEEMMLISGQKPIITRARKSIATYKLRDGMIVGCKVTLRGDRMYEFLDRLVNIALPRVRDFRGISPKSFDGRGNFALGIKEQIVFPEINYDKVDQIRGMDIVICTTAEIDDEARELLRGFNMPFIN